VAECRVERGGDPAGQRRLVAEKLKIEKAQIARTDTDDPMWLDMREQLWVLDSVIREAKYKVVTFSPCLAAMDALVEHLEKLVDGCAGGRQRDRQTAQRDFRAVLAGA